MFIIDDKVKDLEFKTDEYGRIIITSPDFIKLCNGAASEILFNDTNSGCHDNVACGDLECGNAGCADPGFLNIEHKI